jgi:hypothetical protein
VAPSIILIYQKVHERSQTVNLIEEMAGRTQAMKLITQIGGTITSTPVLVSQLVESVGQKLFHHKSDK